MQFLFVAIEGFVYHFQLASKTLLKAPEVSRTRWLGMAVLHFMISVMNNLSLNYQISVPVHIVLKSGGGLVTLVVGTMSGKRYVYLHTYLQEGKTMQS